MNLLQKSRALNAGHNPIMDSCDFPLKYLEMGRLLLMRQSSLFEDNSGKNELVLSMLSGRATVQIDGERPWEDLGGRQSFHADPPTMVYIPRSRKWRVKTITDTVHIAVFCAPARRDTAPALVLIQARFNYERDG